MKKIIHDYSQYTRDDIIEDLFMFVDDLDNWRDSLTDEERSNLEDLHARWHELCMEDEWEE